MAAAGMVTALQIRYRFRGSRSAVIVRRRGSSCIRTVGVRRGVRMLTRKDQKKGTSRGKGMGSEMINRQESDSMAEIQEDKVQPSRYRED